ncbi:DUF4245 domain-containing protein [Streptomyces fragilis]|uniref:DUF4245 domain-containing protein n=1 Tax=Streptomyces fragilis TaxID=67301 RepID=A0ABV2YEQ5_9ACTN|nr:DUF4245 domain-containing protein [Streptomyces fragilis]
MAGMKGKQSVRDMVLSLGLILLAAFVIYLFVPHDDTAPEPKRVDYRVELLTARRAAPYPVAAPEGLPGGWTATSVRYKAEHARWHLGFADPDGGYAALEQSTQKPSEFVESATQGASKAGTARVAGRDWDRYEGDRYDALVLREQGVTTVVTGSADLEELTVLAGALRTEEKPAE